MSRFIINNIGSDNLLKLKQNYINLNDDQIVNILFLVDTLINNK